MEIINGRETDATYPAGPYIQQSSETKTDNYVVLSTDTGKTLVMNSSSEKTFTLFTPVAGDIGKRFTFANINTGKLNIAVAGTNVVLNGGTPTSGGMNSTDDYVATLTIELVNVLKWSVVAATGTWSTT